MLGATHYSGILSRWIKCGVLHSIAVYCQGGINVGCYTL